MPLELRKGSNQHFSLNYQQQQEKQQKPLLVNVATELVWKMYFYYQVV